MNRYAKIIPLVMLLPVVDDVGKRRYYEEDLFTGNHTTCLTGPRFSAGLCPLPLGVCCTESRSCCPYGTKCSDGGRCHTVEASQEKDDFVSLHGSGLKNKTVCPDRSQCPDGFTCCSSLPTGYGCCPLKDAVCCPDQIHCCPPHTLCSEDSSFCLQLAPLVTENMGEMKVAGFHDAMPFTSPG